MSSTCAQCRHWITVRSTFYLGNTSEIVNWQAPDGKGECQVLKTLTPRDFGCNRYAYGTEHTAVTEKSGAPWNYFVMIDCPDCAGGADNPGGRGHRCAGTGKVRLYDDGYIGDEQTRLHPREKPEAPKCTGCGQVIDPAWNNCPHCGTARPKVAETEVPANGGLTI